MKNDEFSSLFFISTSLFLPLRILHLMLLIRMPKTSNTSRPNKIFGT